MPRAVACLLSAAYLSKLLDDPPPDIWLVLPLGTHAAKPGKTPQRIFRWSYEGALDAGIFEGELCGVRFRHTGPARTVVDLIRYARHVGGADPGIRAAKRFVAAGGDIDEVRVISKCVGAPRDTVRVLAMLTTALRSDGRINAASVVPTRKEWGS
jgi:hypothetical protein